MEMIEKVAYLKGLAEGLGIDDTTKEGKVLKLVIDLLDDVVLTLSDVADGFAIMNEQLESIDEELEEIRDDIYDDEDDDDEEEDDDDGCCRHHRHHGCHGFDGELYEVKCPGCGDSICIDEEMLDEGSIKCPGCGETLEFDLDGEIEDEDGAGD
ncbi:MAG: hypothetical protein LBU86_03945 [Oscillospiraceae bacterium]|jgi:ribosomal protein S27E|nr:hypothetical protein [Oscillospiraceae bacterium]